MDRAAWTQIYIAKIGHTYTMEAHAEGGHMDIDHTNSTNSMVPMQGLKTDLLREIRGICELRGRIWACRLVDFWRGCV